MALRINFNSSAVRAHFSLNNVDRQLGATLERMSSGTRLLRTADDPASMTLANQLRHHLSGVVQATENVEESISMIRTGESAMDAISAQLNRMRTLILGAANKGVNDVSQLQAYQNELEESISSIDNIANNTAYGSKSLLNGNLADSSLSKSARDFYVNISHDATQLVDEVQANSTITINPPAANLTRSYVEVTMNGAPSKKSSLSGLTQAGTGIPLNLNGDSITITGGRNATSLSLSSSTTIEQFVGMVNAQSDTIGAFADYNETTGVLRVESLHFGGGGIDIAATDVNATGIGLLDSAPGAVANSFLVNAGNQTINVDYTDDNGLPRTAILIQDMSQENGRYFSGDGFNLTVRDTSTGSVAAVINAATGNETATRESSTAIQVGALSGQRVTLEIHDMRTAALGHGAAGNASGYENLQDLMTGKALLIGNTDDALRIIDAAINEVANERGKLGALESSSLTSTIDSLRVSMESLTESESQLRDTDFAIESAKFAQQNIIFQAATSMLAQANQLPQSVLQLLG
ncbi:MAG: flagellin [Planctomycetes bacterium]|nr:flagellin [Planctomycetota bacterium]